MIEQLIAKIFASRDAAHIRHWKTTGAGSYAEHMALGGFYDAIVGKLDEIVEGYQGHVDLIGDVKSIQVRFKDKAEAIEHLQDECEWIKANTSKIAKGSPALENKLDELGAIYLAALYKLRHLA